MTFILIGAGLAVSIGLIALLALVFSPKKKGGKDDAKSEEKAETEE
jgi:hypothetical protein